MANNGFFTLEDGDIVKLEAYDAEEPRRGWVNIGVHAVRLDLDTNGQLTVEVCARTMEDKPLGTCVVSKAASIEAGGEDPDAEEAEASNESSPG